MLQDFIMPVCLPFGGLANNDLTGRYIHITGWGALEFGE